MYQEIPTLGMTEVVGTWSFCCGCGHRKNNTKVEIAVDSPGEIGYNKAKSVTMPFFIMEVL